MYNLVRLLRILKIAECLTAQNCSGKLIKMYVQDLERALSEDLWD